MHLLALRNNDALNIPIEYLFEHLLSVLVGILSMKELQDRIVRELDLQVLHTTSGRTKHGKHLLICHPGSYIGISVELKEQQSGYSQCKQISALFVRFV